MAPKLINLPIKSSEIAASKTAVTPPERSDIFAVNKHTINKPTAFETSPITTPVMIDFLSIESPVI